MSIGLLGIWAKLNNFWSEAQLLGSVVDTEPAVVRIGGLVFCANEKASGTGTLAIVTFKAIRSRTSDLEVQGIKLTGETPIH